MLGNGEVKTGLLYLHAFLSSTPPSQLHSAYMRRRSVLIRLHSLSLWRIK